MTKLTAAQEKALRNALYWFENDKYIYIGKALSRRTAEKLVLLGLLELVGIYSWNEGLQLTDAGHDWLNEKANANYKPATDEQKAALRARYEQRKVEIAAQHPAENSPISETLEAQSEITDNEAEYALGDKVTLEAFKGHFAGEVVSIIRLGTSANYLIHLTIDSYPFEFKRCASELNNAPIIDQPALPEPKFKVGDNVWYQDKLYPITEIHWFGGKWGYYLKGFVTGFWAENLKPYEAISNYMIPDSHPMHPVFVQAAQRQQQAQADDLAAKALIEYFEQRKVAQTWNASVDAYAGGSENRKAER